MGRPGCSRSQARPSKKTLHLERKSFSSDDLLAFDPLNRPGSRRRSNLPGSNGPSNFETRTVLNRITEVTDDHTAGTLDGDRCLVDRSGSPWRWAWVPTPASRTTSCMREHLDWGFFDHPPMVGVVAALGLKLAGGLSPLFGLRVGYIALFGGSTWLLARLTARSFGPRAGVLAALVLNATVFYGVVAGTLAGPDGPLLFFWLLTLDRLAVALNEPERSSGWVVVGIAWGAAMLSKYHAVLLPAGALLYLLLRPSAHRCLRTPGPYLAAVAGLAVFAPVVVWNATHGWASFAYQSGRAVGFPRLQGRDPDRGAGAQVLYLTPWVFVGLIVVVVRLVRRGPRTWSDAEAFYFSQALPVLGLFLGVATFRQIMAHWPMIGFVALMPLLGRTLSERWAARPRRVSRDAGNPRGHSVGAGHPDRRACPDRAAPGWARPVARRAAGSRRPDRQHDPLGSDRP